MTNVTCTSELGPEKMDGYGYSMLGNLKCADLNTYTFSSMYSNEKVNLCKSAHFILNREFNYGMEKWRKMENGVCRKEVSIVCTVVYFLLLLKVVLTH